MASRRKYRIKWLRWHGQYERLAYKEFQKMFHKFANNIDWNKLTEFNYVAEVELGTNVKTTTDTYHKVYKNIGLIHGKRVGKDINKELKAFTNDEFTKEFIKNIALLFSNPVNNWTNRITTVNSTYAKEIINLLKGRLDSGMTIEQAQREVRKIVNKPNFNRFQALRIARTESTASANFAATQASGVSGFKMQKEWISAMDNRTRDGRKGRNSFDHVSMNRVKVAENEDFNVSGERLSYPGDPRGSAGNVINCRCTTAVIPVRDNEGNLVPMN